MLRWLIPTLLFALPVCAQQPTVSVGGAGPSVGVTPVVSAAAESGHILKAGPGNLYSLAVTTGAAAGYVMTFDALTVPGDGSVAPVDCWQVTANNTISGSWIPGPPHKFATGIVTAFSTTGCFTKTASATAFFSGYVQ